MKFCFVPFGTLISQAGICERHYVPRKGILAWMYEPGEKMALEEPLLIN